MDKSTHRTPQRDHPQRDYKPPSRTTYDRNFNQQYSPVPTETISGSNRRTSQSAHKTPAPRKPHQQRQTQSRPTFDNSIAASPMTTRTSLGPQSGKHQTSPSQGHPGRENCGNMFTPNGAPSNEDGLVSGSGPRDNRTYVGKVDLRRRSFVPESVAVPTTHGDDLVSGTGGTDRSSSEQVEAMARAYSENTVARFEEESPKMVDVANHVAEEHTSVTELSNFKAALEDACKSLEDIEFEFQTEQADHDQVHLEASDLIQAAGAKLQEATKIMQEAQKNYDKVNQAASNTIQAADTKLHEAQMSREGKIQDTKRKLLSDLSK